MTNNFESLNLPKPLINRLNQIGFTSPTEIQSKTIPLILSQKDVLASSKTGSGKTGAFVIPIISRIITDKISAIILCPTRELAIQIKDTIHNLRHDESVNTALIFGGSDIARQIQTLRKNPNIIIATPGRLNDHIKRRTINLSQINVLVLDEFDRMLDMGFKDDIKLIVSKLPSERQTLMFSATTSKSIKTVAKEYLVDHSEVILENTKEDHKNIQQDFIKVSPSEKYEKLLEILSKQFSSTIIFVATKRAADDLYYALEGDGHKVKAIHGDLRQRERERVIKDFRNEKCQILVATDVVARGFDVPHVGLVINYNMPKTIEDYTHRIGRTGRADATGLSISLISPSDSKIHRALVSKTDPENFKPDQYQRQKPRTRSGGFSSRENTSSRGQGSSYGRGSFRDGGSEDFQRSEGSQRSEGFQRSEGSERSEGSQRSKSSWSGRGQRSDSNNSGSRSYRDGSDGNRDQKPRSYSGAKRVFGNKPKD